jgi:hypothetical protein
MLDVIQKTAPQAFLTEPLLQPSHAAAIMSLSTVKATTKLK